jgi:hypothetical protein
MVDLRDQGEAFALEPVHHPHLPQRPLAVEGPGQDLTHDLLELAIRTGGWQAHVSHVVVQVEAMVVDPDRVSLEGREGEPTPVAGEEVKARLDVLPQAMLSRPPSSRRRGSRSKTATAATCIGVDRVSK